MGYDVHITRAKDWSMNDGLWILPDEWLAAANQDVELEIITETEPYIVTWLKSASESEMDFYWSKGNIISKNPTEEIIIKMEAIANRLQAKVQGDDGEVYQNGAPMPEPVEKKKFFQICKFYIQDFIASWRIKKSMKGVTCPFEVGDRVKTFHRTGGIVIEVDPKGHGGLGGIKVQFPDGVVIGFAFIANGLEKESN